VFVGGRVCGGGCGGLGVCGWVCVAEVGGGVCVGVCVWACVCGGGAVCVVRRGGAVCVWGLGGGGVRVMVGMWAGTFLNNNLKEAFLNY
jgi:hypothetical protein